MKELCPTWCVQEVQKVVLVLKKLERYWRDFHEVKDVIEQLITNLNVVGLNDESKSKVVMNLLDILEANSFQSFLWGCENELQLYFDGCDLDLPCLMISFWRQLLLQLAK